MQQKCILHSEQISRKREIKYFQIPLQGTAIKIIAVEVSAFLFSQLPKPEVAPQPNAPSTPMLPQNAGDQNEFIDPPPDGGGGSGGLGGTGTGPTLSGCPNPGRASIDPMSESTTGVGGTRTQVFRIGAAVNPSFQYSCGVYSVTVSVTAVDGDTPATIATKLATEVNNTSLATWSQYGSNNRNFKPSASADGDVLTLTVDYQHSFYAAGSGECSGPPPPPPPDPVPQLLEFDPLFRIVRNERAGVLSLQSPDATDIFYQCDAWRRDSNTGFGDFTFSGEGNEEPLRGRKRLAPEVSITTASPILEAYYKDSWGLYADRDLEYGLNVFIWFEKEAA